VPSRALAVSVVLCIVAGAGVLLARCRRAGPALGLWAAAAVRGKRGLAEWVMGCGRALVRAASEPPKVENSQIGLLRLPCAAAASPLLRVYPFFLLCSPPEPGALRFSAAAATCAVEPASYALRLLLLLCHSALHRPRLDPSVQRSHAHAALALQSLLLHPDTALSAPFDT